MKNDKVDKVQINKLVDHKYTNMMRMMDQNEFDALVKDISANGLLTPIDVMVDPKSKKIVLLDGRNRKKAYEELELEEIQVNVVPFMDDKGTLEFIRGKEQRRHQSNSSKAIMAWKYQKEQEKLGVKISIVEASDILGADRRLVSLVKKIVTTYQRPDIIATLANGNKINVSDDPLHPVYTDNLTRISKWVLAQRAKMEDNVVTRALEGIVKTIIGEGTSIEEEMVIRQMIEFADIKLSKDGMDKLANDLYAFNRDRSLL